jgi:hypothetical protein
VPSAKHQAHARSKKQEEARRRQHGAQADAASKKGTLVNERWFTLFIMDVIERRKMLCICICVNAASLFLVIKRRKMLCLCFNAASLYTCSNSSCPAQLC